MFYLSNTLIGLYISYDILKTYTNNVYNYAKNESTIHDLYLQLDKIPTNMNNSNTYIFISAGGNDILNKNKN